MSPGFPRPWLIRAACLCGIVLLLGLSACQPEGGSGQRPVAGVTNHEVAATRPVDAVYVVTSTMGFEALLVGKPVTTFGVPWYAGWGVTDDRVTFEQAQDIWKKTEPTLSKTQRKINRLLPVVATT